MVKITRKSTEKIADKAISKTELAARTAAIGLPHHYKPLIVEEDKSITIGGIFTGFFDKIHSIFIPFMFIEMLSTFGAMLIGGIGSAFHFMGGGTDSKNKYLSPFRWVGDKIKSLSNIMNKPTELMSKEVGGSLTGIAKWAEPKLGDKPIKFAESSENFIAKHANKISNFIADKVGSEAKIEWLANRSKNKIAKFSDKLTAHTIDINSLTGDIKKHISNYDDAFKAIEDAKKTGSFSDLKESEEIIDKSIKTMKNSVSEIGDLKGNNSAVKKIYNRLQENFKKIEKPAEKLSTNIGRLARWNNPAEAIRNIPKSIAKANIRDATFNTAIMANAVAGSAHLIGDARTEIKKLQNLCGELEGKNEPASISHILFGDTPKIVQAAKSQLTKQFGIRSITEAISTIIDIGFMLKGHNAIGLMTAMGANMFIDGEVKEITAPKYPIIDIYEGINEALIKGREVPQQAYAEFICATNNDASKNGVMNGLVQEMAEKYADEQASPALIAREIENGVFNKKATEMQKILSQNGRKIGDEINPDKINIMERGEGKTIKNAEPKAKIVHNFTPMTTVKKDAEYKGRINDNLKLTGVAG